jgi:Transcriptional regulatory protein, C terminal
MLGALEVRDGAGSPREVSGTRLRALLILLALRAGQVVPASSLIDELWGEQLPADAPNALQALVSRLRRAVGEPSAVASGPAGYQLRIGRDDVDVFRFERLAARGHAALAARPAGELGTDPSPELAALHVELLRADGPGAGGRGTPAVGTSQAAARTRQAADRALARADVRQPGTGQLDTGQLDTGQSDTGQSDTGQSDTGQTDTGRPDTGPRGNLPAALTSFIGRESDLDDVAGLLREYRLVTGPGRGRPRPTAVFRVVNSEFCTMMPASTYCR